MNRDERREEYLRKLRDPRWQKKRLEVMQRDEFTCQNCFDSESTLNVHHNYYKAGNDPWDYPLTALVTLCETCHQEETETRRDEEQALLDVLRKIGMNAGHVNALMYSLWTTFPQRPMFTDQDSYGIDSLFKLYNDECYDEVIDFLRERRLAKAAAKNMPEGTPWTRFIPEYCGLTEWL